jgi:hypothetical protein
LIVHPRGRLVRPAKLAILLWNHLPSIAFRPMSIVAGGASRFISLRVGANVRI